MVEQDADIVAFREAFLQDLLAAQATATMHQRHMRGDVGKVDRLLDRGVAAADHDDALVTKEETVAGGAGGNAVALEFFLARDAQPFRLGAGGNNQRVTSVNAARVADKPERALVETRLHDMVGDEMRADVLGLRAHLLHQPRPLNRLREAGIVFDVRRDHQLAALIETGDERRLQHGARGVDRRRIARGP